MTTNPSNEITLKEKNLDNMKVRILEHVKHTINTKSKTEQEVKNDIRAIIMEEANKNY